ncbi:hypothetical protein [Dehalobacter sp. TeCB1]|uniref:hypothetical protein n=1 Tax=Dehalobacter sp. TeCB1 TaxID=1843715 RepID=UPI00083B9F79|nr:hypothetical protein [Dehalobacter sp. TeCB1]OCZ53783.1 hypothetical protein A7D23_07425 [Dehalobacter sp. TeCB1]
MKLEFTGVNTNKLHDELIAGGVIPQLVESKDEKTWVTVEESQVDAVNAIVSVHDPTPLPAKPTETDYLLDLDYRLSKIELGI